MRGALCHGKPNSSDTGIIPADAGSTYVQEPTQLSDEDHPRGCGEHTNHSTRPHADFSGKGSSPRMRGAQSRIVYRSTKRRIIPADAGSTRMMERILRYCTDHPRGCGEHIVTIHAKTNEEGSSPRMRGAHRPSAYTPMRRGIIPADAGSTGMGLSSVAGPEDHPRGCGEHPVVPDPQTHTKGSSPWMRGARLLQSIIQQLHGIIPADAGSTNPF